MNKKEKHNRDSTLKRNESKQAESLDQTSIKTVNTEGYSFFENTKDKLKNGRERKYAYLVWRHKEKRKNVA